MIHQMKILHVAYRSSKGIQKMKIQVNPVNHVIVKRHHYLSLTATTTGRADDKGVSGNLWPNPTPRMNRYDPMTVNSTTDRRDHLMAITDTLKYMKTPRNLCNYSCTGNNYRDVSSHHNSYSPYSIKGKLVREKTYVVFMKWSCFLQQNLTVFIVFIVFHYPFHKPHPEFYLPIYYPSVSFISKWRSRSRIIHIIGESKASSLRLIQDTHLLKLI